MTANMLMAYYGKGCDSRFLFENRKLGRCPGWDRYLNQFDVIRFDMAGIRSRVDSPEQTLPLFLMICILI